MFDYNQLPMLESDVSEQLALPNYIKIYDIIFGLIDKNILKSGDPIPSENKLAEYWNVSRGTIRMAMRKMEEDGFITKTQGRQATVSTYAFQARNGFQWLYNVCLDDCLKPVDEIKIQAQYRPSGVYISREMGYKEAGFLVVSVSTDYFRNKRQIANTLTVFDAKYLNDYGLDMDNEEAIKKFVVYDLYQISKRSKVEFNVLGADENTLIANVRSGEPVIIIEEMLMPEINKPLIYTKHQLLGSMYRFTMERRTRS